MVGAATPNDDDDDEEEDDDETAVGAVGSRHAPVWQGHLAPNEICRGAIKFLLDMCPPISLLCADLEAWLLLEVPKIEDGNSFGTEIQEHMLKEIRDLGQLATKLMLLAQRHHTDRAELAMKWCRYPGLNDFAVSDYGRRSPVVSSDMRFRRALRPPTGSTTCWLAVVCVSLRGISARCSSLSAAIGRRF